MKVIANIGHQHQHPENAFPATLHGMILPSHL